MKLNYGQKKLLQLIDHGKDSDGWTSISKSVMPVVQSTMSTELVEFDVVSSRVKLTKVGVDTLTNKK